MNPLLASAPPPPGIEIFERILAAPAGLILLEGRESQSLTEQFRAIVRRSGQAVYLWQPDLGLGNLIDALARVP